MENFENTEVMETEEMESVYEDEVEVAEDSHIGRDVLTSAAGAAIVVGAVALIKKIRAKRAAKKASKKSKDEEVFEAEVVEDEE